MALYYKSTRNSEAVVTASQAVLKGLAKDGGLFVPSEMPRLSVSLDCLCGCSYQEAAFAVMREFLTDFTEEELKSCIRKAYDSKFDTAQIAPLVRKGDDWYLELFHGATVAFKDMALSILPHLLTIAARKNAVENEIVILAATSGDTGKAALAGFADVEGTRVIVFFPKDGVSKIQKLQMVTQKGSNVDVVAIHGNFDQAQSGVKEMFADTGLAEELAENGYQLSSANSINIGRLIPQVVYYVYAYVKLLECGGTAKDEAVNIVVPTGNFGNILAAYYAKNMGVPIDKLICASNENKVLFDFFQTGVYDTNRAFVLTSSPSMDILVSSNLERLIYLAAGEDPKKTRTLMGELKTAGKYTVTDDMREKLSGFAAGFASEEDTARRIREVYRQTGYVMDTHTAVASYVCSRYKETTKDKKPCIIVSTASPYKFAGSVMTAIDEKYGKQDEIELLAALEKVSGVAMPKAVRDVLDAEVLHDTECEPGQMKETVRRLLRR